MCIDLTVRSAISSAQPSLGIVIMQNIRAIITAIRSALFLILLLLLQAANPMPITPASTSAAANSATLPRNIGGSRVALVDSGSTCTAFPTDRITQRNPNMRVKFANGVTLPVEFIGSIVLRISAGDVRNGNGYYSAKETLLELLDTLYVPGLCATLLSTKA
eukprot:1407795-Pleurochrysis_carterae.AAC.1